MTDTKLREALEVISDDMQQAGDTYRTWGDNRLGSIMMQWARKLRAALDEPPEQAPEPTEGDRLAAVSLRDGLFEDCHHATHTALVEGDVQAIYDAATDRAAQALATARAQGEAAGVEAGRADAVGYLQGLAYSVLVREWTAKDGLLLAAKDIEHALHTKGAK